MLNKHFFKVVTIFTVIILLGILGVFTLNSFAGGSGQNAPQVAK